MQPVNQQDLEQIIKEARQAGKDVSELEATLETIKSRAGLPSQPVGQRIERTTDVGKVIIESTGPAREEDFDISVSPGKPSSGLQASDTVDESRVTQLLSGDEVPRELIGRGFSYRHDWGDRNGWWDLRLNWGAVNRNSRVFVAIGEGAAGGGKFLGSANYTLHNVAPRDNGVDIRVYIGHSSPIRLYVDYLVVNP